MRPAGDPDGAGPAVAIADAGLRRRVETALAGFGAEAASLVVTDAPPAPDEDAEAICLGPREVLVEALRSGAAAALPDDAGGEAIAAAARAVLAGFVVLPRDVADLLLCRNPPPSGPAALSGREQEVLRLLAEGASNKAIARTLAISPSTAKFHVASILAKLDAKGRTDAVAQAARLGLLLL
jgi:DNA-binding NarL/FixJ family response regulator